ncbi:hypothetical protein HO173_010115 [Letharia columbiana]|uniref:Uncharacterized protein n=1 Tax=Letharia columbiana TaxID=112416 RepID=A0A8H6FN93_9LECA|nr:uncharacterized protein HO173_010115 [Letharia columbiana]KAF6231583.1 hypothetical protein HO173_010115 [Letharia columbiana]
MPRLFMRSHTTTTRTSTRPEPEYTTVLTEPPKKPATKGQATKKHTTTKNQFVRKPFASKTQPGTEQLTAASRPTRKPSDVKSPSPKNHTTSKSQPTEKAASGKDKRQNKDTTRESQPNEKAATAKDKRPKNDNTGEEQPATKHPPAKTQSTTKQRPDQSQPPMKHFPAMNQSATQHPTINKQPTESSQTSLKIVRIPRDGSPMRIMEVALSDRPPLIFTDARTEELEADLVHLPKLWDCVSRHSFRWGFRTLLALLTHTDLRTITQSMHDRMVTPDNFLYTCLEAGSGLRLNGYLSHLCGVRVYGDAFIFRWDPQQYGPDGRATLIDTEDIFIESGNNGIYVPKLLCNFFKPGEGNGIKL